MGERLTVEKLKEKLAGASFVLSGEELGISEGRSLFDTHLPNGTLTVDSAQGSPQDLTLEGEAQLGGPKGVKQGPFPFRAVFVPDSSGKVVTGVRMRFAVDDWSLPAGHLKVDPTALQQLGKSRLHLVLAVAEQGSRTTGAAGLGVELTEFPSPGSGPHPYVWGTQPMAGEGWTLMGDFAPVPLKDLDDLAGLGTWAGVGQGFTVPWDTSGGVSLTDLRVMARLPRTAADGKGALTEVFPLVTSSGSWKITDGFTVADPRAQFEITNRSKTPRTMVGGRITVVQGVTMNVSAQLPRGVLSGRLEQDVSLDTLLQAFNADLGLDQLKGLRVKELFFSLDTSKPYPVALGVRVASDISIDPVKSLAEVYVEIRKSGSSTNATLECAWKIGDGKVALTGERDHNVWKFSGEAIGVKPADLFHMFGADAPPVLKDVTLDRLGVSFSTGDAKTVTLDAQARMPLGDIDAQLSVTAVMTQQQGGVWKRTFNAQLVLQVPDSAGKSRALTFALSGDVEKGEFTATCAEAHGVTIADLVKLVGVDDTSGVSEWLDGAASLKGIVLGYSTKTKSLVLHLAAGKLAPSLTVVMVYPKDKGGERLWVLRAGITVDAGLTQVPLLKDAVPKDRDLRLVGLSVLYAPQSYKAPQLKQLNAALDAVNRAITSAGQTGLPRLPDDQLPKGTAFGVDVLLPGTTTATSVSVRPPASAPKQRELVVGGDTQTVVEPDTPALATVGAGGGMSAPLVAWVDVHKALGPLRLERAGVSYAANTVWVLFEASLGMAGLTLGVLGLGIGVPIKTPADLKFRLDGLSLSYDRSPLTLMGALVNQPTTAYNPLVKGAVVVSVKSFGLTALGAYACPTNDGAPSMFVFGKATGQFGGPPPVKLTALMAGFGYNTSVRVPEADKVFDFPFLKDFTDTDPLKALDTLMSGGKDAWVRPAVGQLWFAAGLGFQLFEFIDCQALLTLEVGDDFAVSLLGTAEAAFPKGAGLAKYAQAKLGMSVTYRGSEQILKATAQLAPGSFVIDEHCVLTGGFAFYLWFDDAHRGDFVVTLGGYHPKYAVPAHYPRVPALGFNWPILPGLTMSGRAYFALTPGAIMAGGRLEVHYRSGDLHAWLVAGADLLIEFSPFRFDARIEISIGVSYVLDLWLVRETIKVEVGATLGLWGPPTAGFVTVHLWFIDVTIDFGDDRKLADRAATWDEFRRHLPAGQAVKLSVTDGLIPVPGAAAPSADDAKQPPWVVAPGVFSWTVRTVVPSTSVRLSRAEGDPATIAGASRADIRLLRGSGEDLRSELTLTLSRTVKNKQVTQDLSAWRYTKDSDTKVLSNLPAALWSRYQGDLGSGSDRQVSGQLTGVNLRLPLPHQGTSPGKVMAGTLLHDDRFPDGPLPLRPLAKVSVPPTADAEQLLAESAAHRTSGTVPPPARAERTPEEAGRPTADLYVGGTGEQTQNVAWARRRLFEAMAYLGVSPGFNDALDPLDPLVSGDTTTERKEPDIEVEPTPPGPRLYALGRSGRLICIDTDSLTVASSDQIGNVAKEDVNFLAIDPSGTTVLDVRDDQHIELIDISANPPGKTRTWTGAQDPWFPKRTGGVAFSPDAKSAYVLGIGDNQVVIVTMDPAKGTATKGVSNGTYPSQSPRDVAVAAGNQDPANPEIYVCDQDQDTIYVWKNATSTNPDRSTKWAAGPRPARLAVDPKGRWVYAVNDRCATVSVVAVDQGVVVATLPTGTDPNALTVSADGTRLFVASPVSGTVSVFDTSVTDAKKIRPVGDPVWVGDQPLALAASPDGGRLFVALKGVKGITVVDTSGPEPILLDETVPLHDGSPGASAELDDEPMALAVTVPAPVK
ncbi:DUF6603 domain-containing protein [Streptomyces sp. NPDC091377]|uniref:DUF6603 domain-containing protein n=1 Tax=Streptomyces sp. NPDC091377 TaxID=3365995 RepID=UPI003813A31F